MRPRVRVSGSGIAVALVLLAGLLWTGCESAKHPLEPSMQAAGAAGPTVKSPSNTNAVAASQSRIDVSWQDNSTDETGFEIHRAVAGAAFALLVSTAASVTGHSDGEVSAATQYCYKVRAFRTTGKKTSYSAFSAPACATTPAPPLHGSIKVTTTTSGDYPDPDG